MDREETKMKTVVTEAIKFIEGIPCKFISLGNSEFSGFYNEKYELYFAGNNLFFFGLLSIITLKINDVNVNLNFSEKRALEKVSKWWWDNVPESQLGVKR